MIDVLMEVLKLTLHLTYAAGSAGNRSFTGTNVRVCLSPACLPSNCCTFIYNRHNVFYFLLLFLNFIYLFVYLLIYFWLRCEACGILVPQPGIELGPQAARALSP